MPYYGLIVDGVLVQKQTSEAEGFVKIPDDAVCGQIKTGKTFVDAEPNSIDPRTPPTETLLKSPAGEVFKITIQEDGTLITEKKE